MSTMSSKPDYTDFVHTGPGALAGRYMRTFWHPIYRSQDLQPGEVVPVQLMSERFTLYRGEAHPLPEGEGGSEGVPTRGAPHLVAFRCAHRGTQLSSGTVEGDCLRCLYHGWKYDGSGQCVEQPGEDPGFAGKIRMRSHPIQEYLGLVFVYIGEGEPPPFRRFPDFERPGVLEVGPPEVWPCNYFNRIDNACDSGHVPYTHRESVGRANQAGRLAVRGVQSEETEYGVRTETIVPDRPPSYLHFHMPNINQSRSAARVEGSRTDAERLWVDRLFFRVPLDDEHSVSFVVDMMHLIGEEADAYRQRRRQAQETQTVSLNDLGEAVLAGRMRIRNIDQDLSIYKLFWVEDYAAQVGQGPIADRSEEHLGRMDSGVILLRKLWQRELRALAEGRPLKPWATPAGLADMSVMAAASSLSPSQGERVRGRG